MAAIYAKPTTQYKEFSVRWLIHWLQAKKYLIAASVEKPYSIGRFICYVKHFFVLLLQFISLSKFFGRLFESTLGKSNKEL